MIINRHVADRDLVLALDHELPRRRAARVAAHLARCAACRSRMASAERTFADVGLAYQDALSSSPSAEHDVRGRLQRQLAEVTHRSPRFDTARVWRPALTDWLAVACALVIVAVLSIQGLRSRDWWPQTTADAVEPGALPVAALTPGATRPVTLDELCHGQTPQPRTIPAAVQQEVLRDYHMGDVPAHEYELDYLITPELGGSADRRNLWPERYTSRKWNARVKDELENLLPRLVCEGRVALVTAQRDIATDWIAAYKKYFQTDRPLKSSHVPRGETNDGGAAAMWATQMAPRSPGLAWRR